MGSLIASFIPDAFQKMLLFSVPPRLRGEDSGFAAFAKSGISRRSTHYI
jgi:hypothetical protein